MIIPVSRNWGSDPMPGTTTTAPAPPPAKAKARKKATAPAGASARGRVDREGAVVLIAELFREYGYHGTSYGQITEATGLGKGSLYNYFPDGKEGMTRAVLAHVHGWFEDHVFAPLEGDTEAAKAVAGMFKAVDDYFHSGRRICLLGAFSLYDARDAFDREIAGYFTRWVAALKTCLRRGGVAADKAGMLAMACMVDIQGGLVMAQALDRPAVFRDTLKRSRLSLDVALEAVA